MSEISQRTKRRLTGVVVSDKSSKTIVVRVERRVKHPKYSKFLKKSKKFHAHDELEKANIGDTVTIIESRPRSRLKRWDLLSIKA